VSYATIEIWSLSTAIEGDRRRRKYGKNPPRHREPVAAVEAQAMQTEAISMPIRTIVASARWNGERRIAAVKCDGRPRLSARIFREFC